MQMRSAGCTCITDTANLLACINTSAVINVRGNTSCLHVSILIPSSVITVYNNAISETVAIQITRINAILNFCPMIVRAKGDIYYLSADSSNNRRAVYRTIADIYSLATMLGKCAG